ncbi:MAG TPA: hypothetical protein VGQ97_07935 [Xanthobacteraceae bacterium]|nr:hypothetical protein [Xanthobacteraceae bacterium]
MRALAAGLLLVAVTAALPASAQQICKTGFGTCRIGAGGTPGGACTCLLSNGPVQGVIEGGANFVQPAAERLPQYCCTPAGRFPSANTRSASGQGCQARLPNGSVAAGQACY